MSLIQLSPSNGDSLLINSGSFSTGKIIRTRNELVFYTDQYGNSTGYRWLGNLPHTINGNSPQTDGGISSTSWESYITANLYDKLKSENITLSGTAHLPTVEVSYGLPKGSLKVWTPGSTSSSSQYWLYTDGTVWGGVGTLGDIPDIPFTQLHLQRDVIKYSYIVQNDGENSINVPYIFSDASVYLNGMLLNQTTGSYKINGTNIEFNMFLSKGDNLQILLNNVPVTNINFLTTYDLSLVSGASLVGTLDSISVQDYISSNNIISWNSLISYKPLYVGQIVRLQSLLQNWSSTTNNIPYGSGDFIVKSGNSTEIYGFRTSSVNNLYFERIIKNNIVNAEDFGCVADSTRTSNNTDCTIYMNNLFSVAIQNNYCIQFSSTSINNRNSDKFYYVSSPIIATGIHEIRGKLHLKVDSNNFDTSSFNYVLLLGDPNTNFTTIQNSLDFDYIYVWDSGQRAKPLNGIHVKYTGIHGGTFRAHYFNGRGVHFNPCFDSVVNIWTEVCGNTSAYAIHFSGNGDITNQITVPDMVCHDSYHSGLGLFGNKCSFDRIHLEGTYTLTTSDGRTSWLGKTFLDGIQFANHIIDMPASVINAFNVFDSTAAITAEGTPTFNQTVGTHLVIGGGRATVVNSLANTSTLNKTTFVTAESRANNPFPGITVSAFQGYQAYMTTDSRTTIENAEIYGYFQAYSNYGSIKYGYIESLSMGGGLSYENTIINSTYIGTPNSLQTPSFTKCTFTNGISGLSTGNSRFYNCDINSILLNSTVTPERADFKSCNITGTTQIDNAINSTNYKNISFDGTYFNGNISLPTNISNAYSSVKFLGSSNFKGPSSIVSNFSLPTTSVYNGMICQYMGNPASGTPILSIFSSTGWKTIATAA